MKPVKKDGVWVDADTDATVESLFVAGLDIPEHANVVNKHKRKLGKLLGELLDALCGDEECEVVEEAVENTHSQETTERFTGY